MIEIRIHGRGGQGGVTLAKLISATRFLRGDSVQAFGLYAAERSGAPVQAFCRYDTSPITNRNLIYRPDHVIVLDPTLMGPNILAGLKPGGWVLINTPDDLPDFAQKAAAYRWATIDASAIARKHKLGTRSVPIVNTALAGAAGAILGFELDHVREALTHLGFVGANLEAAAEAHAAVATYEDLLDPTADGMPAPETSHDRAPSFLAGAGGGMPGIRTGQWATTKPRRQRAVPPCNHVCPAGNDVQGFLAELAQDNVDSALEILLRTSPFPSLCGRVCPAPCMENCNRIQLDGAVNVRQLERYAGDHGYALVEPEARREEHVAIVGSGPAGLTAAYHLGRFGYRVTVHEGGPTVGGLLRTGIPEFRLPEATLERELDRIRGLGVLFEVNHRVDRAGLLDLARTHDAVLVATGLQELRSVKLSASDEDGVVQGIDFLDRVQRSEVRVDGEDVIVVGGGNTAMDAARSAIRLGAASVRVIYRRTRDEMPAIPEEIDEAIDEGVEIDFLTQPVALAPGKEGGNGPRRNLLSCERMMLGEPDESGRRSPVAMRGSDFVLECHRVILALGQSPDLQVFPEGTEVREGKELLGLLETPVFAIGDLATREGTVAGAIGSGRRTAYQIHETLCGQPVARNGSADRRPVDVYSTAVVEPADMKLHLFERKAADAGEEAVATMRVTTFDEVHQGLESTEEAKRCLSCGVCDECDRCVTYCPDGVLKRVGHEFVFDYSYCKGCAVCATECPRSVVFMSQL
ncbi:2-oxoacid:acceptor oxidoreductase family protein [bacterium]|nr:2-oxoacid:acceptor oxidoreductase family protein [bacterium]